MENCKEEPSSNNDGYSKFLTWEHSGGSVCSASECEEIISNRKSGLNVYKHLTYEMVQSWLWLKRGIIREGNKVVTAQHGNQTESKRIIASYLLFWGRYLLLHVLHKKTAVLRHVRNEHMFSHAPITVNLKPEWSSEHVSYIANTLVMKQEQLISDI